MPLAEYGIQNEESHLRVHVCFCVGKVYVFPTKKAAEDCLSGRFPIAPAKTGDVVTAKGWLAPVMDIRECRGIPIPGDVLRNEEPPDGASHSERGNKAVAVVMAMLKREMLPLKVDHEEIHGRRMQIKGTDIKVNMNIHLQVKCDKGGGEKPRGSGNLYLQSHESNPNGSH
tara:strand:- start:1790 stop:2302 length:513 start_codon:yes stop_codon:yes gene_type:complete